MWLTPTSRGVSEIRGRLLGDQLTACLRPQVLTFDRLAREVLAASRTNVRLIARSHRRQLIRRLIDSAAADGAFRHFAGIADTDGLIGQIEAFITELKRLDIWPEELRESYQRLGLSNKDKEFLAIYEAYQESLRRHDLFDAEGCSWAARANLKAGQVAPYESLRLVVVDGFTDFTRTQHEILEILAGRIDQLIVSLPLDLSPLEGDSSSPSREELFEKSRQTLDELKRRHGDCDVESLASESHSNSTTAIDALAGTIFAPVRQRQTLSDVQGINVIAAAQQVGEIREVARRVKKLLADGDDVRGGRPVPATDIAVVFRSLGDNVALIREVFAEYGLPIAIEAREPLGTAPVLKTLTNLLQLSTDDWPYRRLLAIVTHHEFRPTGSRAGELPSATDGTGLSSNDVSVAIQNAEQLVRHLQVPQGRHELLTAAARLAQREVRSGNVERERREQLWRQRAQSGLPPLEQLDAALAQLPHRAELSAWAAALVKLLEDLGFLRDDSDAAKESTQQESSQEYGTAKNDAVTKLVETLTSQGELLTALAGQPQRVDLNELILVLEDIYECETLPQTEDPTGRVRVLSAAGVRMLSVPYLFVGGLTEQAFPPPLDVGRLYSDAEAARLIEAGIPLTSRQQRGHEEMLLFYEVITRATEQLTFSYPATDAKGEPLLPSPYLDEVIRICGSDRLGLTAVTNLRPLPEVDTPLSSMEMRIQAIEDALSGDTATLAAVVETGDVSSGAANLLPAIAAVQSRSDSDYGPFEGMLTSAAVQARLHERFGPLRAWSPSQLEQYATCPHQFYLGEVLGLEPLTELALEDDYMIRGSLLHHTLAHVHRELNRLKGEPTSPTKTDEAEFLRQFDEVLGELVESWGSPGAVERALREVDRRRLLDWAQSYLEQHAKYDKQFSNLTGPPQPELFEIGFGLAEDEDADEHSTRTPLVLTEGEETIRVAGRVDRVDVGDCKGTPVFNVIDYKSGSTVKDKQEQIEAGLALQLPLYALAMQELGLVAEGAVPWQAGYWRVRKEGFPSSKKSTLQFYEAAEGGPEPTANWEELRTTVVSRVVSLIRGIRQAEFPMHSAEDNCTQFCSFAKTCRVNQTRSLQKQWASPAADEGKKQEDNA